VFLNARGRVVLVNSDAAMGSAIRRVVRWGYWDSLLAGFAAARMRRQKAIIFHIYTMEIGGQNCPDSRGQNGFPSNRGDDVEASGQAILKLLHKAAETAEAGGRRGLEAAQQLSNKLEIAKDRIRELEGRLEFYRGKVERAEEWLYKIASEIEERLIRESEDRRRGTSGRS
jgi:hypothetical protein